MAGLTADKESRRRLRFYEQSSEARSFERSQGRGHLLTKGPQLSGIADAEGPAAWQDGKSLNGGVRVCRCLLRAEEPVPRACGHTADLFERLDSPAGPGGLDESGSDPSSDIENLVPNRQQEFGHQVATDLGQ